MPCLKCQVKCSECFCGVCLGFFFQNEIKMGFQIFLFYFFFATSSCQQDQLGWRQSISESSLGRPRANKPGYLGSTAAAKPLLRLLVSFWPEEDSRKNMEGERAASKVSSSTRESLGKKMGVEMV